MSPGSLASFVRRSRKTLPDRKRKKELGGFRHPAPAIFLTPASCRSPVARDRAQSSSAAAAPLCPQRRGDRRRSQPSRQFRRETARWAGGAATPQKPSFG